MSSDGRSRASSGYRDGDEETCHDKALWDKTGARTPDRHLVIHSHGPPASRPDDLGTHRPGDLMPSEASQANFLVTEKWPPRVLQVQVSIPINGEWVDTLAAGTWRCPRHNRQLHERQSAHHSLHPPCTDPYPPLWLAESAEKYKVVILLPHRWHPTPENICNRICYCSASWPRNPASSVDHKGAQYAEPQLPS